MAAASIIGTGLFVGTALAATTNTATTRQDSLVTKLAAKFNVSKTDVQSVFDEQHAADEAAEAAKVSAALQAKVDAGTLTGDQKKLLETKFAEVEKAHEADKAAGSTKTDSERRAARTAERAALVKWAADNKIDIAIVESVLHGGGKGGRHGGGRGPRGDRNEINDAAQPSN
jgi:hypothetical protein